MEKPVGLILGCRVSQNINSRKSCELPGRHEDDYWLMRTVPQYCIIHRFRHGNQTGRIVRYIHSLYVKLQWYGSHARMEVERVVCIAAQPLRYVSVIGERRGKGDDPYGFLYLGWNVAHAGADHFDHRPIFATWSTVVKNIELNSDFRIFEVRLIKVSLLVKFIEVSFLGC